MQGAQRYVVVAYVVVGLLLMITLTKLFAAISYASGVPDPAILGNNLTLSNVLGIALAIVAGVIVWKNERAHEFSLDVINELMKVTWPSRKETQTATVVVIITTIICAVILGTFDMLWAQITGFIYSSS